MPLRSCLSSVLLWLIVSSVAVSDEPRAAVDPEPQRTLSHDELQAALKQIGNWFTFKLPAVPEPSEPAWVPLDSQSQKQVDDVLAARDSRLAGKSMYSCDFRQWNHDRVVGDKATASTSRYSEGVLRMAKPGKWLWQEKTAKRLNEFGNEPSWTNDRDRSYIACNGKSFFWLNASAKRLSEVRLSPDPDADQPVRVGFFGLEDINTFVLLRHGLPAELHALTAKEWQERFWIRPTSAPEGRKELRLELFPKRPQDAYFCSGLIVVIDGFDKQIKAIDIHGRRYTSDKSDHVAYEFSRRTLLNPLSAHSVLGLSNDPFTPSLPQGWRRDVNDFPASRYWKK